MYKKGGKTSSDVTSMDAVISPGQCDDLLAVCERQQPLTMDSRDTDKELVEHKLKCSHGDSQNYLDQAATLSFEEEMLNSAFLVCDSEGNGKVSVIQIIEYLKSVTDTSRDGNRLQVLSKMFDPDDQGVLVDLQTFHAVMTQWIAGCYQDRDLGTPLDDVFIKDLEQQHYENNCYNTEPLDEYSGNVQNCTGEQADLIRKVSDLTLTNKKLTDQKIRLQNNLEFAEETNSYLTEEIAEIKCKLKSSQQALQQTLSIRSELEDMKTFTKVLEDKISVLHVQKKKLEKEILLLSTQKQLLKEENDKLLTEKEKTKEKLGNICSENSKLMLQLCEYERLLLQKEDFLAQKHLQSEQLHAQMEEYTCLFEELKQKKISSQDQFSQTDEDIDIKIHLSQKQCPSNQPQQSVCKELQEVLEFGLPDPLCGILEDTGLLNINMMPGDIYEETELMLDHLKHLVLGFHSNLKQVSSSSLPVSQLEEQSSIFLHSLRCLMQMKCAWETYASKLNRAPQINTQEELPPSQMMRLEQSIKTVNMQLVPYHRPHKILRRDTLTEGFLSRSLTEACQFLLWLKAHRGSSVSMPGNLPLLFLCSFLLLLIKSNEHIWPVAARLLWPHLRLQHLDMPPY